MINIDAVKDEFKNDECEITENNLYVVLSYKNNSIIDVNKKYLNFYCYDNSDDVIEKVLKNSWFERFYKVINENIYETMYYIKVFDGYRGYLNYDKDNNNYFSHNKEDTLNYKTTFTKNEINKMKADKNIAVDWDKVKLIKVNGD